MTGRASWRTWKTLLSRGPSVRTVVQINKYLPMRIHVRKCELALRIKRRTKLDKPAEQ